MQAQKQDSIENIRTQQVKCTKKKQNTFIGHFNIKKNEQKKHSWKRKIKFKRL